MTAWEWEWSEGTPDECERAVLHGTAEFHGRRTTALTIRRRLNGEYSARETMIGYLGPIDSEALYYPSLYDALAAHHVPAGILPPAWANRYILEALTRAYAPVPTPTLRLTLGPVPFGVGPRSL